MLDFLNMVGVVAFVVFFFGFCVFIHELGHFLAAKWCGLHINAFSIGFKKAWGKKIGGVDYRIGWLPFGGYVDLPQVDSTGSDIKDADGNPLPPGKPLARIITAVAGPLFNIIFGLVLGCVIWVCGVPQGTARMENIVVEHIIDGAPSQRAGLIVGDKIIKLNGEKLNCTWNKFLERFILKAGTATLTVLRDGKEVDITFQPEVNPVNKMLKKEGIASPWFSPLLKPVAYPTLGSNASKAGMKAGDIIVDINGKKVKNLMEAEYELDNLQKKRYDITVLRKGKLIKLKPFESTATERQVRQIGVAYSSILYHPILSSLPEGSTLYKKGLRTGDEIIKLNGKYVTNFEDLENGIKQGKKNKVISLTVMRGGKDYSFNGIKIPAENSSSTEKVDIVYKKWIFINSVTKGKPADIAGMKDGDKIIKFYGKALTGGEDFKQIIQTSTEKGLELTVLRDGKEVNIVVHPQVFNVQDFGFEFVTKRYPSPLTQLKEVVMNSYRSLKAVGTGILYKLGLSDQKTSLGLKNFSGPVGISAMIGKIVSHGSYIQGLAFIVMITFSLGMLNLMPLPVLDGGHIVMACIQIVIGRPLPAKIVDPIMNLCAIMLISFMLYVTVYDFLRLKGDSAPSETITLTVCKE